MCKAAIGAHVSQIAGVEKPVEGVEDARFRCSLKFVKAVKGKSP